MSIRTILSTVKRHLIGNRARFTEYFEKNTFGSEESVSGEGSTMQQTAVIRREIPQLIRNFDIKTFIDAPCGDFNWMRHVDLSALEWYKGFDIVEHVVKRNNEKYGSDKISFEVKNICLDPLPKAGVLLCRDCLVHLSFKDGLKAIKNFKNSGIKYLLITTFTGRDQNIDLGTGIWRALNMELAPFDFPKPVLLINEECTEANNMFTDKSLSLYRVADINI